MAKKIWVGIDWAKKKHSVVVVDERGQVVDDFFVEQSGDGLNGMVAKLKRLSDSALSDVKVGIELPHGPVVETLMDSLVQVFSINPKQSDRFRDRYSPAGAKDDRHDALVLADSLRTDEGCFRRVEPTEPLVIELRQWSRITAELQQDITRYGNRVRQQLERYYPQFEQAVTDITSAWALELWNKIPTPAKARRIHASSIKTLLKKHRLRKLSANELTSKLQQTPVTVAKGVQEAAVAHITVLHQQLLLLTRQHKQAQKKLAELVAKFESESQGDGGEQSDVTALRSLDGIGNIVIATLIAEAWQPLQSGDYHALRTLAGVAPVTKRSGKSKLVQMRYASNARLRNAVYHWARVASYKEPISTAKYRLYRSHGISHGAALRRIGDSLLKVACAMLKSGTLYDPTLRKGYQPLASDI